MKKIILPFLAVVLTISSMIGQVNITFELNTTKMASIDPNGLFVAGGEGMGVPGDHQLTDLDGDGIYSITIEKDKGFSSYYIFLNGNCADWSCKENIEGLPCSHLANHNDRFLSPVMSDTTILACFGTCDSDGNCTEIPVSRNHTSEVKNADISVNQTDEIRGTWETDFFDDFETFNPENWQDQRIWVNNETQCYVPDGAYGTREVSDGTLKVKVVNIGEKRPCDNFDKHGKQHPETEYVAGRICSKNRKEFVKGKWTARLKLHGNGAASMFPAWWILGAQNNEPPVQEADEYICWPLTGSGEIDIFEHHGDYHKDHFTTGAIKSEGQCDKGDWMSWRKAFDATLDEYHEYSVEWMGSDLVYRLDGKEIYRNAGLGDLYPEPMFAILNFAKITDSPMEGEWVMEVEWVKHEFFVENKTVQIFNTAENTDLRLSRSADKVFKDAKQPLETEVSIFVNPNKSFQTFMGIGGAITDASSIVFSKLSKEKQEKFLNSYFSLEEGIGYSLIRTHIHSCDFSKGSYTYVSDEDKELKTFNIAPDKELRIPLIKKAITTAGGNLPLYVSPWSPPAFMKTNKNMLRGGSLLPEFRDAWALYYAKFIKAYEKENIPIWGLTIQNEPMATQRWESCIYTAEEERDFLKNHLGPTLEKEGLGDKKIIVWDHNRDLINHRANTIFDDPEASKYAWGIGFHWYETWTGSTPMFINLGNIKESYPDKNLVFTEGCNESFDANKYEYWPNAERYGRSMINDFNQGTVAWTDWNILLDETGGPNHVMNLCFAPVHADTQTGELIYTPTYYYIGHFSKFIRPNAKRISTVCSRSHLESTSFFNEDGKMVTVIMNPTDEKIKYKLYIGTKAVTEEILPHAMQTLVY